MAALGRPRSCLERCRTAEGGHPTVLDFRKSLEESRQVLSHGFANEAEFKAEVDRHLRAFAKGELPPANAPRDKVLLPLAVLAEVQKEKAEKEQALARAEREHRAAEARAQAIAQVFAKSASKAAVERYVEKPRQDFSNATGHTSNGDRKGDRSI